ncbi:hypothetical protein [Paenibacillus shenyangensis]|uniref:hypothetical protein n=1 Tax=Paenibacillus sp. A9 TaxID=1284352 RepID=UPI00036C207C|nr:hypothetical protein [Paenibacillus sp. A9]
MQFNSVDMKEELLQFLKQSFRAAQIKMTVLKSDPQTSGELPCIGINRVSDSEANHTIGDFAGSTFDDIDLEYGELYGTVFQESMEIRIWHNNADERERVYRLLKALIIQFRKQAVALGVRSFSMEAGKDESDFSGQVIPFPVYWGSLVITYLNPMDVEITEHVVAITSVTVNGGVQIGTER